jgi:hypothetical protein
LKTGIKFTFVQLFILIFLLGGCAPISPDKSKIQTESVNTNLSPAEQPVQVNPTATTEIKNEPTMVPTDVTVEKTILPTEKQVNIRFVPVYQKRTSQIDSDEADSSWDEFINGLARNQAISKPFEWQLAELPDDTHWDEVFNYFKGELLDKGWSITSDGGDWKTLAKGHQTYVGGFIKTQGDHREKISILFYPVTKDYVSHYFVFYSQLR